MSHTGADKYRALTAPYWTSPDGSVVLYHGDCLSILPHLSGVDAVVTDPPYGIDWNGHNASTLEWDGISNDTGSLDLRGILSMPIPVLAFGAACFPAQLPHRGRWLCWDKRTIDGACDAMIGSPFELAWCNRVSGFDKMVRCLHGGVVNADGGQRVHPTQKPIAVMRAAIEWAAKDATTILDPFMGSGTTGVACVRTGRKFIGIEIEERYCAIAKRRIEQAFADQALFTQGNEP